VAVADPLERDGLREALEGHGMTVTAEVDSADDAVLAAIGTRPDICVLDVDLPRPGGIAACARILDEVPGTAVVMLAAEPRDDDLFAALRAGARGYLLAETDPDRLPLALEGVLAGEAALPRTLVARLIQEFRTRERGGVPVLRPGGEPLSGREWEVLSLMAEGIRTREIAGRMGISDVTVRRHVQAVLRKLEVPDRAGAVELLRRAGG